MWGLSWATNEASLHRGYSPVKCSKLSYTNTAKVVHYMWSYFKFRQLNMAINMRNYMSKWPNSKVFLSVCMFFFPESLNGSYSGIYIRRFFECLKWMFEEVFVLSLSPRTSIFSLVFTGLHKNLTTHSSSWILQFTSLAHDNRHVFRLASFPRFSAFSHMCLPLTLTTRLVWMTPPSVCDCVHEWL